MLLCYSVQYGLDYIREARNKIMYGITVEAKFEDLVRRKKESYPPVRANVHYCYMAVTKTKEGSNPPGVTREMAPDWAQ